METKIDTGFKSTLLALSTTTTGTTPTLVATSQYVPFVLASTLQPIGSVPSGVALIFLWPGKCEKENGIDVLLGATSTSLTSVTLSVVGGSFVTSTPAISSATTNVPATLGIYDMLTGMLLTSGLVTILPVPAVQRFEFKTPCLPQGERILALTLSTVTPDAFIAYFAVKSRHSRRIVDTAFSSTFITTTSANIITSNELLLTPTVYPFVVSPSTSGSLPAGTVLVFRWPGRKYEQTLIAKAVVGGVNVTYGPLFEILVPVVPAGIFAAFSELVALTTPVGMVTAVLSLYNLDLGALIATTEVDVSGLTPASPVVATFILSTCLFPKQPAHIALTLSPSTTFISYFTMYEL
jgi:hypothetical protein